ncbi:MAG TPA: 4-(cytidine 5'-diphospho)-2-C-methyl-D-erythritol kinase [Gemmatimonadales bacterium]
MTVPEQVRVAAHAKLNLFLRILATETDGYHQVETAYALLELADELLFTRTGGGPDGSVELEAQGPDLGPVDQNLAVRAARAIVLATGKRFGVRIELTKHIPVRAGLGGGSSDAAAALHAVNALAGNAVPRAELLQFAGRLGADVPFFASGSPLALGWGRGQRLYRLTPLPVAPALVAVPPVAVATPDAYRWWDEGQQAAEVRGPVVLDADTLASWGSLGRLGGNDFEIPVFGRHPEIRILYEKLAGTRPLWVRLCGSGSAVAAVYRNEGDRDDAAAQIGTRGLTLIRTATRAAVAPPPDPTPQTK